MRYLTVIAVLVMVVLAGCSGFGGTDPTPTPADNTTDTQTPTSTPSPTPTETPIETPTENNTSGNHSDNHTEDWTSTFGPDSPDDYTDPSSDTLGWENGYWYDESLPIDASDGLNESELEKVSDRSAARVERLRGIEFTSDVPVEIITREDYANNYSHSSGNESASFRNFDNAKFEAMFLVGEDEDSLAVQEAMRGDSVGGFYTPADDKIAVVSEGSTTELSEETLIHEFVHAAQDQKYNLSTYDAKTRDAYNAQNGLIEGDAEHTAARFSQQCESNWSCITPDDDSVNRPGPDFHWGIYLLQYFPYSDGYTYFDHLGQTSGWDGIESAYGSIPESSEVIIHPDKYGADSPANLTVPDQSSDDWDRVSVDDRPDYATLGESGIFTLFANTLFDSTRESSVLGQSLYSASHHGDSTNDPYNYDSPFSNGWGNDKLYVYQSTSSEELGYVWTVKWDSTQDATEFADRYELLLDYYRASETSTDGVFTISSGSYEDAFYVTQSGDTVTIVNAPTAGELDELYPGVGEDRTAT